MKKILLLTLGLISGIACGDETVSSGPRVVSFLRDVSRVAMTKTGDEACLARQYHRIKDFSYWAGSKLQVDCTIDKDNRASCINDYMIEPRKGFYDPKSNEVIVWGRINKYAYMIFKTNLTTYTGSAKLLIAEVEPIRNIPEDDILRPDLLVPLCVIDFNVEITSTNNPPKARGGATPANE